MSSFVQDQNEKLSFDTSKLVQAPNTNVFLIPPEYFVADPSINGFAHAGSATTIQVIEVPGVSYNVIEASMTPEYIDVITSYSIHYTKLYDGKAADA